MIEERKYAILFAATLLCARKLMELVRDHTKAVVLQLKNVVGMVEGLPHKTEPHGVNAWEHSFSLSPAPLMRPDRATPWRL